MPRHTVPVIVGHQAVTALRGHDAAVHPVRECGAVTWYVLALLHSLTTSF